MPDIVTALRDAARLARKASTIRTTRRVVEVVVTEEGLVVRGSYRDAQHAFATSEEVERSSLDHSRHLATNAVLLVIRRLEEKGEELGITPVREGE